MRKLIVLLALGCASTGAFAERLQAPLFDPAKAKVVAPEEWAAVETAFRNTLECEKREVSPAKPPFKAFFGPDEQQVYSQVAVLLPLAGFKVFALPVKAVLVQIDEGGDYGTAYVAEVDATQAAAEKAAKVPSRGKRQAKLGEVSVDTYQKTVYVVCFTPGVYSAEW